MHALDSHTCLLTNEGYILINILIILYNQDF